MGDTISRHGTSAWLENMGHPNLAKMIMDEKRFPSVQPEPKRGKWIYTGIEQNSFYCDKCLYLVKNMSYKFCPNCGADMREVTNE